LVDLCWPLIAQDKTIRQQTSNLCLELSTGFDKLEMKPCVGTDRQIWNWQRRTPDTQRRSTSSGVWSTGDAGPPGYDPSNCRFKWCCWL